jgi:hypothetical protein
VGHATAPEGERSISMPAGLCPRLRTDPVPLSYLGRRSARIAAEWALGPGSWPSAIGFDPRGIGDSTPRLSCAEPPVGLTADREEARRVAAKMAAGNRDCARTDPELAAQLTTANIARDLDRIRVALGERKLNYLGFS